MMIITREKHMAHLVRLMPLLLLAVAAQHYIYLFWAPANTVVDVSVFMGIGVALSAAGFAFYDHFHQVQLLRNHLLIKCDLISYREEILYRNILDVKIEANRQAYYNVTLIMRDGSLCKLYYLDDIKELKSLIKSTA